jgi:hypothetical protein
MKNAKLIVTILLAVLLELGLNSCKKYPEGPVLSLRSRKERVANNWKVEKVTFNGNDITSNYTNISFNETYDKKGNYSYNSTLGSGSGKWSFQNNDTQIKRQGVSGMSTVELTILKLKEKSFWYRFNDGKDTFEFHLIPN